MPRLPEFGENWQELPTATASPGRLKNLCWGLEYRFADDYDQAFASILKCYSGENLMSDASELYDAILKGNAKKAEEVTKAALAANFDPSELVQKYMIPAMDEVGKRFECNDYFVPELLIAARAMKTSLALITPYLAKSGAEPLGRVVIGTVQGDLHDIGKNLVASMLEGGGFQVVDLGVNVSPQKFVEAAQEKEGTIVALSALLTTTMTMMKTVIDALSQAGIRSKTRVMIGGAPITQQYADEIGADGFTDNAGTAVALARKLSKN
jgi:corrinoid protein of di/trimethylamine methyltransferase